MTLKEYFDKKNAENGGNKKMDIFRYIKYVETKEYRKALNDFLKSKYAENKEQNKKTE